MRATESYIEYEDGDNTVRDVLFTYSEDEKQQHEINGANASAVFCPEFIPTYLAEKKRFGLTMNTAVVYGFIRFFKKNNNKRFYFTNEQLSEMLDINTSTVQESIKKLAECGLIISHRKMRSGGGLIRFIELGNTDIWESGKSNLQKSGKTTYAKVEQPFEIHNNKIQNSKKRIEDTATVENPPSSLSDIFSKLQSGDRQAIQVLAEPYPHLTEETLTTLLASFLAYWTEPTISGKRQRWQMEKTFEIRRRFATWVKNAEKFGDMPKEVKHWVA